MQEIPHIPYDMYESSQELLIIIPLGGVKKESLSLKIEDYKLLTLSKHFHFAILEPHRALADCRLTHQLYEKLKRIEAED